jgi:hypothetical protein
MRQRIYVFFGMVASGKSTLAMEFAGRHDLPYYNTDRVRKELAGLPPTSRHAEEINAGIYSREFTGRTYREMLSRTGNDLAAGKAGVVLDGSYSRRDDREEVRRLARRHEVESIFIHCRCSDEEVKRRLRVRSEDPEAVSDGRWEIYQAQKNSFAPPEELAPGQLLTLETEEGVELLLDRLDDALDMKKDNC